MRGKIIDSIFRMMKEDERVFFVTADMGINLVEKFQESYPKRFLNVGIAEQNMISVCAGLLNVGFRPVAYTISNFAVHRCFEQIRNDICIHKYPLIILGTGTGYDNAPLGPTHHVIDDWGALKALQGIDIYCPSNTAFAANIVPRFMGGTTPAYVRIPKGELKEPTSADDFIICEKGKRETLLVCYGGTVSACMQTMQVEKNVSVLICNKLHPLNDEYIADLMHGYDRVVVVEDQFADCGLYGSLTKVWVSQGLQIPLLSIAPEKSYTLDVGSNSEYYAKKWGFNADAILEAIQKRSSSIFELNREKNRMMPNVKVG